MYKVIDLFSGAGGLSLGFAQTNQFEIVAAAENNKNAEKTYIRNHPAVKRLGDVRDLDYGQLMKEIGAVDVLIGGPPCQGFSNANRQKARSININNCLIKEYVRAVIQLSPRVFIMENVGMLRSKRHRFYLSKQDKQLIDHVKIPIREDEIELLPEAIPDIDSNMLITSLENYSEHLWEESAFKAINTIYRQRRNRHKQVSAIFRYRKTLLDFSEKIVKAGRQYLPPMSVDWSMAKSLSSILLEDQTDLLCNETLKHALLLQRMYRTYVDLKENDIIINGYSLQKGLAVRVSSYAVIDYIKKTLEDPKAHYRLTAWVLNAANYGVPQKRERFVMFGTKNLKKPEEPRHEFEGGSFLTVRDAIEDLEEIKPSTDITSPPCTGTITDKRGLIERLHDSDLIYNHVVTASREIASKRFQSLKQGENFHDLRDDLKTTYADPKRTQNTIYKRLEYDKPSDTVLNVRKSMWIHPVLNRAISIREAARLQTFPDSFVFEGTKDSQYQQVGNAVPPMLANVIAKTVLKLLEEGKDDG